MIDLEKVKAGLECLTHVNFAIYKSDCEKRQCPYRKMDCEIAVMVDALNLLEDQMPRVMLLEEVLKAENAAEPLWCEFIDCALGSWRMGWKLKTKGKREVQHILENPLERAVVWESEYKKGWRCWTDRPAEDVRKAVEWG